MSKKELKRIDIVSLLKTVPLILFIIFSLTGIFYFLVYPSIMGSPAELSADLMKYLAMSILSNTVVMSLGIIVSAFLYNLLAKALGGISVEIENK
jgi:hypothetical protein